MRRFLPLAGLALLLGAGVLAYAGPGQPFVRGHVGDVAATMLVYALVSMALSVGGGRWQPAPRWRFAMTMAIATFLELGQTLWSGTGLAGELLLGATFDAWDFAAYLAGAVIAVAHDVLGARRRARASITSGELLVRSATTLPRMS
jgi:Protein of unknown function (DUF2809)